MKTLLFLIACLSANALTGCDSSPADPKQGALPNAPRATDPSPPARGIAQNEGESTNAIPQSPPQSNAQGKENNRASAQNMDSGCLGATEVKIQERYGKPLEDNQSNPLIKGALHRSYAYSGWEIRIAFLEGKATRVVYWKTSAPNVNTAITKDEAEAILKANKGLGEWKPVEEPKAPPGPSVIPNLTGEYMDRLEKEILEREGHTKWIRNDGAIARKQVSGSSALWLELANAEEADKRAEEERKQKAKAAIPEF